MFNELEIQKTCNWILQEYRSKTDHNTIFLGILFLDQLASIRFLNPEFDAIGYDVIQTIQQLFSRTYTINFYPNTPHRIPDDLDDTFWAHYAIQHFSGSPRPAKVLASLIRLLTKQEVQTGGPYATWIHSLDHTIDPAVNAIIHNYLISEGLILDELIAYIDARILHGNTSKYYVSPLHFLYLASRSYRGNIREVLIESIKTELDLATLPTYKSLGVIALLNLGVLPEQAIIEQIRSAQRSNGSWENDPYIVEQGIEQKVRTIGSNLLSTTICLHALTYYDRVYNESKYLSYATDQLKNALSNANLSPTLFDDFLTNNTHHILLLPLHSAPKRPLSELETISAICLYLLIAITLLDHGADADQPDERIFLAPWLIQQSLCSLNSRRLRNSFFRMLDALYQDATQPLNFNNCWKVAELLIELSLSSHPKQPPHLRRILRNLIIARIQLDNLRDIPHSWENRKITLKKLRARLRKSTNLLRTHWSKHPFPELLRSNHAYTNLISQTLKDHRKTTTYFYLLNLQTADLAKQASQQMK